MQILRQELHGAQALSNLANSLELASIFRSDIIQSTISEMLDISYLVKLFKNPFCHKMQSFLFGT